MLPDSVMKALEEQSSIGSQFSKLAELAIQNSPSEQIRKLMEQASASSFTVQLAKINELNAVSSPAAIMARNMNMLKVSDGMSNIAAAMGRMNFPQNNIELALKANQSAFTRIGSLYPELDILYGNRKPDIYIGQTDGPRIGVKRAKDVLLLDSVTDSLSWSECCDFMNYISTFPMLGYKHPIGKRIYGYIKSQKAAELQGTKLFRIRVSSREKHIPYTQNEMLQAQYTSPKQNRFSMIGLNPLYLADDLETARLETGVGSDTKFTYIELEVIKKFNVLNITDITVPLYDFCHKKVGEGSGELSLEYLVPNFISDCAKDIGFEGIVYNSVLKPMTKNVVLFDSGKRDFKVKAPVGVNFNRNAKI